MDMTTAVLDRIEDGKAVFLLNDGGVEVSISVDDIDDNYLKQEQVSMAIVK